MVFASEVVRSFLRHKQIATLEELKQALGTTSTMTVFRKLKSLGYRTSYSHRGKYYTLEEIPRFDTGVSILSRLQSIPSLLIAVLLAFQPTS